MAIQRPAYRAILQGSTLIWLDFPPELPADTEVYVTLRSNSPGHSQGAAMATALEKLAQINAFHGVDPVNWQREMRQDKPLPGRE